MDRPRIIIHGADGTLETWDKIRSAYVEMMTSGKRRLLTLYENPNIEVYAKWGKRDLTIIVQPYELIEIPF